ncbi:ABC transporter permease subunit/CPBP intramembrane protease [Longimicrobium terrae]|nr:ABC transporter permease subunit/CPBP intramembrane protease [Longimicrobium terrae]MBB4635599.1 sodium transport system permease protein [Longimicrobium terrae]
MRWKTVRTVLAKELRETLRDRRTLFMMLVIPTLLYPCMLVLAEQLTLLGQRRLGAEPARVAVAGAEPALVRFLDADSAIRVLTGDHASVAAVRAGEVEAAVILAPATGGTASREARILFDASQDKSQRAQRVTYDRLEEWGDTLLAGRLRQAGLPPGFARPLAVADSSVATAEETGGYALGRFLPVILVLMTLLGTFYPAIDLAAGEKERGTLETLLTAAVPAREIVAGKFAAVALIGILAAVANLASMLLTFQSGVFRFAKAANLSFTLPLDTAALVLLALIPLAVLFSALFLGIAVRAQSFKEAQNALTPAQLAATLPMLVVTLPGIDFTPALAMVPVMGVGMFLRELMAGRATLLPSILALVSSAVYAAAALAFAARAFGREEVLFGGGSGEEKRVTGGWRERVASWRAGRRDVPLPAAALTFIAGIALLYFHLGTRLQASLGEKGLLASQWLLLALPAVAFAAMGPYDARRTLAIHPPRPRALLAAALIALGGIPVGWVIVWLQMQMFEGGTESLGYLQQLLTATSSSRALWLFLLAAVTPAVCEELVFRGVLLQSLRREMRPLHAVIVSAAIFGAFHLSFETALRFLPTMWIGLLMGFVVWRTRSLFASMLMHCLNNGFVVLLLWQPAVQRFAITEHGISWVAVLVGCVLLAAGLWLLPRDPRPRPPADGRPVDGGNGVAERSSAI